jgi:hypothetical protein
LKKSYFEHRTPDVDAKEKSILAVIRATSPVTSIYNYMSLGDDIYSCSSSFHELGCCEMISRNNKATEIINMVIPWEHHESGKLDLCRGFRQARGV